MINTREIAMKIIYDVEFNGAYSNMALKKTLSNYDLPSRDRAFITTLVYGVIDKKITLDYVIGKFSKLKLKKISKYILIILRMGIYQLIFTDKVPQSAAVNESVKLAKRYGHGASAGFVNGVLRNAAKTDIEYPSDKNEYLSVKYSFPPHLCKKWTRDFGYEFTRDLLAAFSCEPKLNIRPNTLKITAEELAQKMTDKGINAYVREDYIISDGYDIASDELYINGYYTVQDAAAMQTAKILAPKAGETVIDMCAAPGGKTTHMAELMRNAGKIYAFDVHEHKIELIRKNAERLGITVIEPILSDGTKANSEYFGIADKILCDVPCSGFGIVRRKPEIKYNRAENGCISEIQRKILDNAALYLKEDGEMVYSTCTIEKEENEAVTDGFLADNKGFEKLYEKTFYPYIDNTDGFYICKMKRI
ncbi:MAG: 16S rRNA (cytosine(967)-C(5))-methyltransferase RsmB [Oscillospiraceae bacterium]|nr:16S rRNA (cytosine(967)-C(5))-methyltransferase RsmB [Oscillospiraceae bacterium]